MWFCICCAPKFPDLNRKETLNKKLLDPKGQKETKVDKELQSFTYLFLKLWVNFQRSVPPSDSLLLLLSMWVSAYLFLSHMCFKKQTSFPLQSKPNKETDESSSDREHFFSMVIDNKNSGETSFISINIEARFILCKWKVISQNRKCKCNYLISSQIYWYLWFLII